MSQITDLMEDLWIERQGLRSVLANHGFSPEQFLEIEKAAKKDTDLRNQARRAFAQMRASFEKAGTLALIEGLAELPPPSGEPN
jgi:hypothetical protein